MNLTQAKQRLAKLGFVFNETDVPKWGRRDLTEAFDDGKSWRFSRDTGRMVAPLRA